MALALAMPGEPNCEVLPGADRVGPTIMPTTRIPPTTTANYRLVFKELELIHLLTLTSYQFP
jgi:hypothetical protein